MRNNIHVSVLCAVLVGAAGAASVSFTGGTVGSETDLAVAANWPDAQLPGVEDDVTVAVEAGSVVSCSAPIAVRSLTFASAGAFSVTGTGPITLGAGGLTVGAASKDKTVTLAVPFATSAAQQWSLGGCVCEVTRPVTGTETLTLAQASKVHYRVALGYGGDLVHTSAPAVCYEAGPWAKTFSGTSAVTFKFTNETELAFSTLLSGGSYVTTAWDPNTSFHNGGAAPYNQLLLDAGTWMSGGVGLSLGAGRIRQTGGEMDVVTKGNTLFVGDYKADSRNYPVEYLLEGGRVRAKQVNLGMYDNVKSRPALFHQTGGEVQAGGLGLGGGNQAQPGSWGEYLLGGGTLDVGQSLKEAQRGIALFSRGAQDSQGAGVFTQTGGVANVARVMAGTTVNLLNSLGAYTNNTGYGRFDLLGGTFNLGAGGFLTTNWNVTATNAGYTIALAGGTLTTATEQSGPLAWTLPPSGSPFTFQVDHPYYLYAPLQGMGTLRKTGPSTLTVTDATRFTGDLDIREGVFSVAGGGNVPDDTDGALIWSGDDVASRNGLAVGDAVPRWDTTAATHAFTNCPSTDDSTVIPQSATIVCDAAHFNGHRAVYLNLSYMGLSAGDNPLNGATNFTCVFVFRMNQGDLCCTENQSYAWQYTSGILGHHLDMSFTLSHTRNGNYSLTPRFVTGVSMNGNAQYFSEMDYDMNDNRAHVVVVSCSNNVVSITGDGFDAVYTKDDATAAYWPRFKNRPLFLGSVFSSGKFTHGNQFIKCRLAEMRIYPQRALSRDERFRVGCALADKYGVNDWARTRCATVCAPFSAAPAVVPPETDWVWEADDLNDVADGAEVTRWAVSGTDAARMAATSTGIVSIQQAPTLVKDAVNGHSVVRFDGARKTGLAVPAASSPVAGKSSFAAAVVFRSTNGDSPGTGEYSAASRDTSGEGIFGGRTYSYATQDWGFSWHGLGTVSVTWGPYDNTNGSQDYFCRNPFKLHDGLPHVLIFSYDGEGKTYRYWVDGREVRKTALKVTYPRCSSAVLFGTLQEQNSTWGHFSGDVAAARLYDRALSSDECARLSEYYVQRFLAGVGGTVSWRLGDAKATGLAATNIAVSAGATFRVPHSTTVPFTLGPRQKLTGAGAFEGSYRWNAGCRVNPWTDIPVQIEDVQFADGCTLVVPAVPTEAAEIPTLSVSGTLALDASALAGTAFPTRVPVLRIASDRIAPGTQFVLEGLSPSSSAVYRAETGLLEIVTSKGTMVIFR